MFKINKLHLFSLLPHRGIAHGKSRLAPVLGDGDRAQLNRWLLNRTLRTSTSWLGGARHCIVVSPCDEALAIAREAGAMDLRDDGAGLNAALAQAAAYAASLGAQRLLILPCDLPMLTTHALNAITAMAERETDMVIAPDRSGTGTNALLTESSMREFAFGTQSFARHSELADKRGARILRCEHAELAFDLDTPEDYREWRRTQAGAAVV